MNNQGLSAAARGWDKHASWPSGTFEPLEGNTSQKNLRADDFLQSLLNDSSTTRPEISRGSVEYRSPSGQGARFNGDNSFSGILDPKVRTICH